MNSSKSIFIFLFYIISSQVIAQFSDFEIIDSGFANSIKVIATADLNNDERSDIILAGFQNDIFWYKNSPEGFEGPYLISSNVPLPYHIDVADANNDSYIDVLITNNSNNTSGTYLFLNSNAGEFWAEVIIDNNLQIGAFKSFFTDIDNDSDEDIVVNSDTQILSYLNDGNGVYSDSELIAGMNEFYSITIADFNNDSFDDIIANTAGLGTVLYKNSTEGSFLEAEILDFGLSIFLASYDIDNDGNIDFQRGNPNNIHEIQFYLNDNAVFNFSHSESNSDALDVTNSKFVLSDLDGDDFKDILFIENHQILWKRNLQNGFFSNSALISDAYIFQIVHAVDLENDGDQDIVCFGFDESSNLYLGYFENTTLLSVNSENIKHITFVYSNPIKDKLEIKSPLNFEHAELYDLRGGLIMNIDDRTTDLSALSAGVYLLNIRFAEKTERLKIFKI